MIGSYDPVLVGLSILIAVLASYTALDLAGRVTAAAGRVRLAWLGGGSVAMGIGIWSMHFVGMLAFRLPVPIAYDVPLWLLSVVVAIVTSAFALWVVGRHRVRLGPLVLAAILMGAAIAGMHYVGMAAMRMPAHLDYHPPLVVASVAIAMTASFAALWLAFRFREDETRRGRWGKAGSATVMGFAIAGMHYTGMEAARFSRVGTQMQVQADNLLATSGLAVSVVIGTLVILGLALLGAMLDRRLRARAEEALAVRRSEERFRSLVEATAQIVWTRNAQGEISEDQPGWSAFTGQSFQELRGRGWLNAIHPDDRSHTIHAWESAVRNRTPYEVEHRLRRRDGEYRHMLVRAVPVLEEDGEVREWIGVHTDITPRKQAEHEREQAIAARGRFYAAMSHELRTPINAIIGYNDLILAGVYGPIPEKPLQGIQRSQKAAQHLLELVNDVLDLSKLEAGKVELQLEPVSISALIEDLLTTIRPVAEERGSELVCDSSKCTGSIITDPRRVRQILLNLLSNAIKFGGGKPVGVRCSGTPEGGIRITVTDHGIGIAPDDLSRVFEEFVQLTEHRQGGTGLGLSISRRLANLLGGTLGAESIPGAGSTFCLTLPSDPAGATQEFSDGVVREVADAAAGERVAL